MPKSFFADTGGTGQRSGLWIMLFWLLRDKDNWLDENTIFDFLIYENSIDKKKCVFVQPDKEAKGECRVPAICSLFPSFWSWDFEIWPCETKRRKHCGCTHAAREEKCRKHIGR